VNHAGLFDPGQPHIKSLELVGEAAVVDAQQMEHGGVQVTHVDHIVHGIVAQFIGWPSISASFGL